MMSRCNGFRWLMVVLLVGLTGPAVETVADEAKPSAPDSRVQPGARFSLSFPNLPKDRGGNVSEMEVGIPKSYDPGKSFPLIVWLAGGEGSSKVGAGPSLVDADKFILAGMPYPKGANNPNQANMVGNFKVIWSYHRAMLEELHRVVPNINPDFRILGGFSNGGHCIDGVLGLGALEYFNTFILADGGGAPGGAGYRTARGGFMFVCWGEKSPNKGNSTGVAAKAKKAGMQVKAVEMKGIGHEFAKDYQDMAREWVETVVTPARAEISLDRMKKLKSRHPAEALAAANGVDLLIGEKDEKIKAEVARTVESIEAAAAKDFEKIRTSLSDDATSAKRKLAESKLKSFVEKYQGTKAATEAMALLDPSGKKEEKKEDDKEDEKKGKEDKKEEKMENKKEE